MATYLLLAMFYVYHMTEFSPEQIVCVRIVRYKEATSLLVIKNMKNCLAANLKTELDSRVVFTALGVYSLNLSSLKFMTVNEFV